MKFKKYKLDWCFGWDQTKLLNLLVNTGYFIVGERPEAWVDGASVEFYHKFLPECVFVLKKEGNLTGKIFVKGNTQADSIYQVNMLRVFVSDNGFLMCFYGGSSDPGMPVCGSLLSTNGSKVVLLNGKVVVGESFIGLDKVTPMSAALKTLNNSIFTSEVCGYSFTGPGAFFAPVPGVKFFAGLSEFGIITFTLGGKQYETAGRHLIVEFENETV